MPNRIDGAINLTGSLDVDSTLNVDGASTLVGAVGITGNLTVTGFIVTPVEVGMDSVGASILGIKAGASTNDAAVGGVLYVNSTAVGNVLTGEDDLMTYTVPADTLAVNNQELRFEAWGTYVNNANSKTLKVLFGTDSFTILSSGGGAAFTWYVTGRIIRTGAATQDVFIKRDDSVGTTPGLTISTATRTLSGSNVLKLTGTGTSTNDIVQEYFKVWWEDANA